jgi:hypothetical protein
LILKIFLLSFRINFYNSKCGKSPIVLKETEKYMERAILLDQNNVDYLNELGSQKLSQEKTKDAFKCYTNALKKDEQNITALLGRLKCQIVEEKLDDVGQQFELLTEAIPQIVTNPVRIMIKLFLFFLI